MASLADVKCWINSSRPLTVDHSNTYRVAISNHRIVSLKDGKVTFKYKNRKTNQMEPTTIEAV